MKVLVTRGGEEAEALVRTLIARGHEAVAEPLFTIEPVALPAGQLADALTGVQALLFTSANGVRAFAGQSPDRGLPVFAVGDATAAAARAAGFVGVESAQGNVEDLAGLVAARLDPAAGALFHGAASDVAGDLKGLLDRRGFEVRRLVLYRARAAERLSEQNLRLIQDGALDAVLFFSPRTGKTFVRLLGEKRSRDVCSGCHAVCLSAAVAAEIRSIAWAGVHVADQPDQEALLAALDRVAASVGALRSGRAPDTMPWSRDETKETMTDDTDQTQGDGHASAEPPALQIIAAFGGIRPMASKLGVAVSTVQGWRERAAIPKTRHDQIRAAAGRHAITLDADLLDASATAETPDPAAEARAGLGVIVQTAPSEAAEPAAETTTETAPDGERSEPSDDAERTDDQPPAAESPVGGTVATPPPSATPAPRRGGVASFVLGAAVLAAGFVLAVLFRGVWMPYLPADAQTADTSAALDAMTQDVAAVKTDLAALAETFDTVQAGAAAPDGDASEALAAIDARLGGIDERIAALESRPQGEGGDGGAGAADIAALTESMESLGARIETLEAGGDAGEAGVTLTADLAAMDADLTALATRLDGLESAAAAPDQATQAVTAEIAALRQDSAALQDRLAETEAALAAMGETESALEESIAALKEATTSGRTAASQEAALALALTQLRDGLRSAAPYAAELAQVRALVEGDPVMIELLQPLSLYARSGVPTEVVLRREFPAVARAAVAAARGDTEEGLLSGVLRRVSSVVTVRPVGEVEGDGPGAIVARAESRLEVGDFAGAVAEVATLTGPAAITAEAWLRRAEGRLAADAAISALAAEAIAKLAAAGD